MCYIIVCNYVSWFANSCYTWKAISTWQWTSVYLLCWRRTPWGWRWTPPATRGRGSTSSPSTSCDPWETVWVDCPSSLWGQLPWIGDIMTIITPVANFFENVFIYLFIFYTANLHVNQVFTQKSLEVAKSLFIGEGFGNLSFFRGVVWPRYVLVYPAVQQRQTAAFRCCSHLINSARCGIICSNLFRLRS